MSKSVKAMPNEPTKAGWSGNKIREYQYKPVEMMFDYAQTAEENIVNAVNNMYEGITSNRIGLLNVSDYDSSTGEITFTYDEDIVESLEYNESTGVLTITY